MKIRKYDNSSKLIGKLTRSLEEEKLMSYEPDGEKVYTLVEFLTLLEKGEWEGGKVQGLGYVRKGEFVKSSETSEYGSDMITFVHGSSINGDNIEEKFASIFSFIKPPYDNKDPDLGKEEGGTDASGDSHGNSGNSDSGSSKPNPSYKSVSYCCKQFQRNCIDIQVDCCVMYDCVLCYFYLTYNGYINDDLTISYVYALNNKSYLQENILYHKKGAINFNHEPIGNIAFNLKNGVLDASLMLKIKKNQSIADFYII